MVVSFICCNATAFYPAYHPLNQCKCRETVFPYLLKSRDSCWCREQLPLLFQFKQRHRTCHGTYISHHFNILCTAGFLRSRILNTMWSVWNVYWWYAQNRSTSCYCMCGARASKIESNFIKLSLSSCVWLTVWVSLSLSCSLALSPFLFPEIGSSTFGAYTGRFCFGWFHWMCSLFAVVCSSFYIVCMRSKMFFTLSASIDSVNE